MGSSADSTASPQLQWIKNGLRAADSHVRRLRRADTRLRIEATALQLESVGGEDMRQTCRRVIKLAPALVLAGCVDNLAICVDSGFGAAIVVQVRDAVTGAPLAAGARGTIRDGAYVDSLRPPTPDASGRLLTLTGGAGRAGTYDVTVVYPGYLTWQQRGVVVNTNSCGVASRLLHADLQPQPRGGA